MTGGQYVKELCKRFDLQIPVIIWHKIFNNYYVPEIKRIVISKVVWYSHKPGIKAIGAHEVAHAMQDKTGYWAYKANNKFNLRIFHLICEWDAMCKAMKWIKQDHPSEVRMSRKILNRLFLTHAIPVVLYYSFVVAVVYLLIYFLSLI